MAFVFISFQSNDRKIAEELQEYITKQLEVPSFLSCDAIDGIDVGKKWPPEVCRKLEDAEVVCIVVSPNWVRSKYCDDEYRLARYFNKQIFTITFDEDKNVKDFLDKEIGYENYIACNAKDMKSAFESLSFSIESLVKKSKRTPFVFRGSNPYKGLLAYEEKDAAVFFGRDDERKKLVDTIINMPFNQHKAYILYGSSGTGKSSLLKAGVLPYLCHMSKTKWAVLPTYSPTVAPFNAFARVLAEYLQKEKYLIVDVLKKSVYNDELIEQIVADIERQHCCTYGKIPEYILISIDQLEEAFLGFSNDKEENILFMEVLKKFTFQPQVYIVATLRSDFLYEFQSSTYFKSFENQNVFKFEIIHPISHHKISEIIKAPAKLPELRENMKVDDEFIDKIKSDLEGVSDVLPLLSLLLSNLYEKYEGKLFKSTYHTGDLGALINTTGEDVISPWRDDVESVGQLKNTFIQHLVQVNENEKFVKVRVSRSKIPKSIESLIEALINSRLLLSYADDDGVKDTKIEIAHEMLIKHWVRLREWVESEREFLKIKKEVEKSFIVWNNEKHTLKEREVLLLEDKTLKKIMNDGIFEQKLKASEFSDYVAQSMSALKQAQIKRRMFIAGSFFTITGLALFGNIQFFRAKHSEEELKSEITKTKHNIGLLFADRAVYSLKQKKIAKAHLYASYALKTMDLSENGIQEKINVMVGILSCFNYVKTAYLDEMETLAPLKVIGTNSLSIFYTTTLDGNVWKNDLRSGDSHAVLSFRNKHKGRIYDMKLSEDTSVLYTASSDRTIKKINVNSGGVVTFPKVHKGRISSIVLLERENTLISASYEAEVIIWNLDTLEYSKIECPCHSKAIRSMALSNDKKFLLSASYDKSIGVFDVNAKKLLYTLKGHDGKVNRVIAHPLDAHRIFSSSDDGTIREWHIEKTKGKMIRTLSKNSEAIYDLQISADAKRLFASSKDETITIWNLETNIKEIIMDEHSSYSSSLSISKDNATLVTTAWDKTIRYWDMKYYLERPKLEKSHHGKVTALSQNNGHYFATGGEDNTIKIWNNSQKVVLKTLYGHQSTVYDLIFYANQTKLISISNDRTIRLWDIHHEKMINSIQKHRGRIYSLSLDPTERYLASGSQDGYVYVYDLEENNKVVFSAKHDVDIFHVYFINNRFLATVSGKNIQIWDRLSNDNVSLYKLEDHQAKIYDFVCDSAKKYAYSSSQDGKIFQWKLAVDSNHIYEPKYVKSFTGHTKEVDALVVSKDGKRLISAARDNTIKVWNTSTQLLIKTFKGHTDRIYHIRLLDDEKTLLSASWDGSIRIWNISDNTTKCKDMLLEFPDCEVVSTHPINLRMNDGKIIDEKVINQTIANLEKQFQITMQNRVEEDKKILYDKPIWSKYHPLHS